MDTPNALGQPHSIVVFRALQLGDMLCAVPALRALRNAYPDARIALVGLPWCATFAARFACYIDEFIEFPGYPGLPEILPRLDAIPGFLAEMQHRRFDAAIQLHGSGSYVNSIVMLFNTRTTAGFFVPGEYCPDAERFIAWPEHEPEIMRYLTLMEHLGIAPGDSSLEFPLTPLDHSEFAQLGLAAALGGKPYVIIHPGAQLRSRRWPPERFAEVADGLPADHAVILTGSAAEWPVAQAVEAAMKRSAINLAGKTSLGALAVLLRHARLLVSNDTGLSHMAAALRVPSVIICSASDPQRWSPLDRDLHSVLFHQPVACRPCAHEQCPIGHPCALALTAERIIPVVRNKLARHGKLQMEDFNGAS
ncbi:hypothetical protein CAP31_06145 [Sulfuriferula sp. AH1]|uniref:glycosyltransferase family 9 protein n=1 Tax=Sulfuriferula sp. AH1 TaxID=1985873 RepID=UPI000B3B9779|nr:glycosyltransferase family 9 protein [Sulfuriferula sp. AH1]ARU31300.1 hypothetical protein CAP31_06145 [Sulfuriferula sp. AH1]